jgi:hypothetical protein
MEDHDKTTYKSFSLQMRQCKKNGILVKERCPKCGQILLMCKQYGGQCISNKCRNERIK